MKKVTVTLICLLIILMSINIAGAEQKKVYRIEISGEIDPGLAYQLEKGIGEAEKKEAELILIEIDTYGGVVDSAIKIRNQIMEAEISTVTYVDGRAWSAGALIALAGENLFMVPGSSIGAAETRPKEEKYISAVRKEFAATAERRGRNPLLAEAMVDADIEVEGIIDEGKLLTLTAEEALENEMIEGMSNTRRELLEKFDLAEAELLEINLSAAERMARVVTNPYLSAFLLTLGFIALLIEIAVPGFGAGGTVGFISFAIFFSGHAVINDTGWGLAILFIIGFILILLEAFVIPGFGVPGLGGIIAILASIFFVFPSTEIALSVIAFVLLFTIIGGIIIARVFGNTKFWTNISLQESQKNEAGYVSHTEKDKLLGKQGVTITTLRPSGAVDIDGERIDVVSESAFIAKDVEVKVIKVVGNRVVVKKIAKESD